LLEISFKKADKVKEVKHPVVKKELTADELEIKKAKKRTKKAQ